MTDTARYADVVFPATTQLEQTDVVPSWGHLWLGWNEAAIEPVGESVPNTELWRRLAAAMGFDEPELFESDESLLRAAMPTVDLDELRAQGWKRLDLPDPLLPYADGGFATPDGRAALMNPAMAERGLPTLPTYVAPGAAGADGDHGAVADGAATELPLVLHTPKYHTRFLNSSYSHLPAHGPREGGPWCEITAADAAARGIADGDVVEVRSATAALRVAARIGDRVQPGMVAVPFGWWGDQHPDQPGGKATVNSLTTDAPTDWGGGVAYGDTRVEVVKI
jgi:anaerobic selenocysteine-containing dehydrogenase